MPQTDVIAQTSIDAIVIETKRQREFLLRLYYIHHSFDSFDPLMVKFIITQLCASMAELRSGLSSDSQPILQSTFLLCGTALRTQAKFLHLCTLAYCAIQSDMRAEDLQLLLTHVTLPTDLDMPPYANTAITSWPLPIIKINENPKKSALNILFKQYASPGVDGEGSGLSENETASSSTEV